ncbi:MAG: PadR family transcriptional regulator [Rubrobacteraceae bacterium]
MSKINTSRLLILGMLSDWGPMHGHQIRQQAQIINAEAWGDVKVGSLYSAINRMRDEEFIEPVRTEREGKLPTRTIYKITPAGERELYILLDRGLREMDLGQDSFNMALSMCGSLPREELEEVVRQRKRTLSTALENTLEARERLKAKGFLLTIALAIFRHSELRLETELRWHDELLEMIPTIVDEAVTKRQKREKGEGGSGSGSDL